ESGRQCAKRGDRRAGDVWAANYRSVGGERRAVTRAFEAIVAHVDVTLLVRANTRQTVKGRRPRSHRSAFVSDVDDRPDSSQPRKVGDFDGHWPADRDVRISARSVARRGRPDLPVSAPVNDSKCRGGERG